MGCGKTEVYLVEGGFMPIVEGEFGKVDGRGNDFFMKRARVVEPGRHSHYYANGRQRLYVSDDGERVVVNRFDKERMYCQLLTVGESFDKHLAAGVEKDDDGEPRSVLLLMWLGLETVRFFADEGFLD